MDVEDSRSRNVPVRTAHLICDGVAGEDAAPPLVAGVLASPPLERAIRLALGGLNLRLDFISMSGLLVARIEAECPRLLILDLDICPGPDDLTRFARSLRPDILVAAVHWYWAERETPAFADVLVHKPVRRDEWFPAIAELALRSSPTLR